MPETITANFVDNMEFDRFPWWFKKLEVTEAEIAELGPSEALKQGIVRRNETVQSKINN